MKFTAPLCKKDNSRLQSHQISTGSFNLQWSNIIMPIRELRSGPQVKIVDLSNRAIRAADVHINRSLRFERQI